MRIIGHRGAAGIKLENTINSIQIALAFGVDAIEFDVHQTKDKVLVVHHDADLKRLSGRPEHVKQLTYKELRAIPLKDGSHIPTLREVLDLLDDTTAIIELKQKGIAEAVLQAVDERAKGPVTITSFHHSDLRTIKHLQPSMPTLVAEHHRPFEIVDHAITLRATGININAWLLNPLTYYRCRRANLSIMAYTVNNRFIAWFLRTLYPRAMLCTDRPDKLANLR